MITIFGNSWASGKLTWWFCVPDDTVEKPQELLRGIIYTLLSRGLKILGTEE